MVVFPPSKTTERFVGYSAGWLQKSSGAERSSVCSESETVVSQTRPSLEPKMMRGTISTLEAELWSAKAKLPKATSPVPGNCIWFSISASAHSNRHWAAKSLIRPAGKRLSKRAASPQPTRPSPPRTYVIGFLGRCFRSSKLLVFSSRVTTFRAMSCHLSI